MIDLDDQLCYNGGARNGRVDQGLYFNSKQSLKDLPS